MEEKNLLFITKENTVELQWLENTFGTTKISSRQG